MREPVTNFYGRDDIIKDMKEKLDESSAVVISSMGGCGKTQTVAKFVQNHKHEFDNIFWLVASTIQTSLQDIFWELTASTTPGNQQGNLSVLPLSQRISKLTHGKKVLYVVDDVFEGDLENLKILFRNASSTSSKFLITTQLSDVCDIITSSNISSIKFPQFTDEESKTFLQMNILQTSSDEDIEKLSSELNAFPLCLQQAVSYINKHNTPILAYIRSFKECKKPILDPKKTYSDYDRTLLTVWSVALDKLKASPKALQVLAMMSMMDNSCIRKKTFLYNNNIAEDEIELNEIIDNLCEYSLVQTTGDRLIIHALVQKVIGIYLEANKLHLDINLVRNILYELLRDIAYKYRDIRNVDKENLWYIHLLKLFNVVQFENSTGNKIYRLISEMASKRGDMKTVHLFLEKEFDYWIQCYRDYKTPFHFFEALNIYTGYICRKTLTKEDITNINSFEKEFESELDEYQNEVVVLNWKWSRYFFLNCTRLLAENDIQTINLIQIKREEEIKKLQMSNDNNDLSLKDRFFFFRQSIYLHLTKRDCNKAKAVLVEFKKFMTDNDFPIDQGIFESIKQYYEAQILYLEGNHTEALNVLTEIPMDIDCFSFVSVTVLKICILIQLRRFNEARDCLPTDDECKKNLPYSICLSYIQFMRNNFDEMKDLLRGFNIDLTFYCHLYAMAWIQFNQRRHFLTDERKGQIVFYLVIVKRLIVEKFEDILSQIRMGG